MKKKFLVTLTSAFLLSNISITSTYSNNNIDKNDMANQSGSVTVKLYKKGSNIPVESKSVSLNGGTVKFSGLDKDTLYYIDFSKATDTKIYSFDGLIY